jgi:hypothetical protein
MEVIILEEEVASHTKCDRKSSKGFALSELQVESILHLGLVLEAMALIRMQG